MTTIINTPATSDDSGAGIIIGVIIALLVGVLFFVFGLPYIQKDSKPAAQNGATTNVAVTLPTPTSSASNSF